VSGDSSLTWTASIPAPSGSARSTRARTWIGATTSPTTTGSTPTSGRSPILNWTRDLVRERKRFTDESYETLDSTTRWVWAYRRGDKTCVINMTATRRLWNGRRLLPWECLILDETT
jgi:hypothetical protein